MKKPTLTTLPFATLALAACVRKPLPPPSRPFKAKHRPKRNDWKKAIND